jgi:putative transcriptional regulator
MTRTASSQRARSGDELAARFPVADADIVAAALTDPDNLPMTREELDRKPRLGRSRGIRRQLGLTQEDFAERYQIPLGTLRDWEQGRTEPDAPAKAYLSAIAGAPELVLEALRRDRERREEALRQLEKPR